MSNLFKTFTTKYHEKIQKVTIVVLIILLLSAINVCGQYKREIEQMENDYNELHWSYDDLYSQYSEFLIQEETNTTSLHNGAEKFSNVPLDPEVVQYIYDSAVQNGFRPEIIFAMAQKESSFNPTVYSRTGDYGLFQINKCNFNDIANHFGITLEEVKQRVYEPLFSCDCSMYILSNLRNNYPCDNYSTLLMYYNMGPSGARKLINNGTYSTEYSRDIVQIARSRWNLDSLSIM